MQQHWVQLGNSDAVASGKDKDDRVVRTPVEGDRITALVFPEGWGLSEMYSATLASASYHFDVDLSTDSIRPPVWVESSSPGLATVLREHYALEEGRPAGWEGDHPSVASLKERGESDAR